MRTYASSVKGLKKPFRGSGAGDGGRRETMVRLAKTSRPKMRNAQARLEKSAAASQLHTSLVTYMAHGKPIWVIRRLNMMGRKTPPKLEPPLTMPMARPLLRRNHVVTQPMARHELESTIYAWGRDTHPV